MNNLNKIKTSKKYENCKSKRRAGEVARAIVTSKWDKNKGLNAFSLILLRLPSILRTSCCTEELHTCYCFAPHFHLMDIFLVSYVDRINYWYQAGCNYFCNLFHFFFISTRTRDGGGGLLLSSDRKNLHHHLAAYLCFEEDGRRDSRLVVIHCMWSMPASRHLHQVVFIYCG